jgi:LSD1 subclass zinc finger protein
MGAPGIFIRCPKCSNHTYFDGIPAARVELVLLRGSEEPVRCKHCQTDMDTLTAFHGERIGSDIVRREDPEY